MSVFYPRMLAMLALIDKEPAVYGRKDLAERYSTSIATISETLKAARNEFDVKVEIVGFGKDKRYKLIDWGGFKGSWVHEKYERHQSIAKG